MVVVAAHLICDNATLSPEHHEMSGYRINGYLINIRIHINQVKTRNCSLEQNLKTNDFRF